MSKKPTILISGMTATQTGSGALDLYNIACALRDGYRALGAEVRHERPYPGDTLEGVDLLIMGIISPTSLTARTRLVAATHLMYQAFEQGVPMALFVDDWDVRKIMHGVRTYARKGPSYIATKQQQLGMPNELVEFARENGDALHSVWKRLYDEPWPPTIVAFFDWGDRSIFTRHLPLREEDLLSIDMTPIMRWPDGYDPLHGEEWRQKKRKWVLAALTDQSSWLERFEDATWPIDHFGRRFRNKQVVETELYYEYGRAWGNMCPPYYHSGAGWLRPRIVHSAMAGNILIATEEEFAPLIERRPELRNILLPDWRQVESLSDDALRDLAFEQRKAIMEPTWMRARFDHELVIMYEKLTGKAFTS